jgi:hypothetical protein
LRSGWRHNQYSTKRIQIFSVIRETTNIDRVALATFNAGRDILPTRPGAYRAPNALAVVVGSAPQQTNMGFWQSLADPSRKIRCVVRAFCSFGDVAAGSKISQWQVRFDLTSFVEEFVEVTVGE